MNWESQILALISASLVRPFGLALAAILLLRLFRVEHPASRHSVWSAVLAGMLILPFASVFIPHFDLPALPEGSLRFENELKQVSTPGPGAAAAVSDRLNCTNSPDCRGAQTAVTTGCAAHRSQADDGRAFEFEMLLPAIASRIE